MKGKTCSRSFGRMQKSNNQLFCMSRLDKAFVSLEWLQAWPNATQFVPNKSISNYDQS